MCTAISHRAGSHYFGRNLDLERSYGEAVTITPRNYPFSFRNGCVLSNHYAMIGMAVNSNNYPLYFDATNEKGLSMAGLNFPGNACYYPYDEHKTNIAPFEFIPWILGTCADLVQAKAKLKEINLWNTPFSQQYPLSPLHWLISDGNEDLTIECTVQGFNLYPNDFGVLTNNPPFPYHLHNMANYMTITAKPPSNNQPIELKPYSLGLGSFGLPGDMSSGSRFVKAAITKFHCIFDHNETHQICQFFHILSSVCQQHGMTQLPEGEFEYTRYSSCCDTTKGIYYYRTYYNSTITAVSMHKSDLTGSSLDIFPLRYDCRILHQN